MAAHFIATEGTAPVTTCAATVQQPHFGRTPREAPSPIIHVSLSHLPSVQYLERHDTVGLAEPGRVMPLNASH